MTDKQKNQGTSRPELMPEDTPDYMAEAWVSFISWAAGQPKIIAQFRAATGSQYAPPKNAIEAAVDEATGAHDTFAKEFIRWVNKELWGKM